MTKWLPEFVISFLKSLFVGGLVLFSVLLRDRNTFFVIQRSDIVFAVLAALVYLIMDFRVSVKKTKELRGKN